MKHAAKPPHSHVRQRPAAERTSGPSSAQVFVENRPSDLAQRQPAATIQNSPQVIAQRQLVHAIQNSPRVIAQRKQLESAFGGTIQCQGTEEEELLQGKFGTAPIEEQPAAQPNRTGLPDNLKSGIESLSGISMDGVKVHYGSDKPAQLNALAYAQGTDIHVAPGREQHLPHEAWHVVQQAQGRVKPTMQMRGGVPVNDDEELEHEADVMGARALETAQSHASGDDAMRAAPVQRTATVAQLQDVYFPDGGAEPHVHMHPGGATFAAIGHGHKNIEDGNGVREDAVMEVFGTLKDYDSERARSIIQWLEAKYGLHPPANDETSELESMLLQWGGLTDDKILYYDDEGTTQSVNKDQGQSLGELILEHKAQIRDSNALYARFLETGSFLSPNMRNIDFDEMDKEQERLFGEDYRNRKALDRKKH